MVHSWYNLIPSRDNNFEECRRKIDNPASQGVKDVEHRKPVSEAQSSYNLAGKVTGMKKIYLIVCALMLCIVLALAAGCSQPAKPVATPTPTAIETMVTSAPTPIPTTISSKPEPTQTLPDAWSLDVQVAGNGEAIDPQVITTIRGGKGMNFILAVDVKVTRADGKVETGKIPRQTTFRVGDSVSLPVTSQMGNVNRVEVWATIPQGNQVKIFDDFVPFRTYN